MRNARALLHTALLASAALLAVAAVPLHALPADGRIEATIKSSYNFRVYLAGDDITVKATDGVVTLSGTVADDRDRTLALETASDIAGVKRVTSDLQVKPGQPAEQTDAWITMKVKGALAFHKNVSASGTEVATAAGKVTLKGVAENEAQRELTASYAQDVEGVKGVDNRMTVAGARPRQTLGEKIDDASITAQIKTSLLFHHSTHAVATKVATRDGVVILRGEAGNAAEKSLVGKLAEDTQGVIRVDNQMSIKKS